MKLLLVPGKTFLYALKHGMYGILFWYALTLGAVSVAVSRASAKACLVGFVACAGAYLAARFVLRRCTWIVGKQKLLERQIRRKEKLEGLKEYLFGVE